MRITILPLIFLLTAVIFLSTCSNTYALDEVASSAYENDIGQSRLHPAHPLYFLKTVRESLELKFAGTERVRILRKLEFATRRLREVKSLVSIGQFELIIPALENYWIQITSLPPINKKDTDNVKIVQNNLVVHADTLRQVYDQITNPRAKMAIRSALNRLAGAADLPDFAKALVCELFAKEASVSSALNEVEKVILKERSDKCYRSLEVVLREKTI